MTLDSNAATVLGTAVWDEVNGSTADASWIECVRNRSNSWAITGMQSNHLWVSSVILQLLCSHSSHPLFLLLLLLPRNLGVIFLFDLLRLTRLDCLNVLRVITIRASTRGHRNLLVPLPARDPTSEREICRPIAYAYPFRNSPRVILQIDGHDLNSIYALHIVR